jgi:transcriptional regulator CtsR
MDEKDYGWIECDVCAGGGNYLVMTRYGQEHGWISCPKCGGCGDVENVPVERRAES